MGQHLNYEEETKRKLMMVCTLPTEEDARKFMRASEDIELNINNTVVQMFNFADYKTGEPPPPTPKENMNKDWDLIGVIVGPEAKDVPDSHLPAEYTEWAEAVRDILEDHGLEEDEDEVAH